LEKIWKSEEWGGNFEHFYNWEVGKGRDIQFSEDDWVGSGVLKNRFRRLFSLFDNKEAKLSDYGVWVNNFWQWNLTWRRGFFSWEESQVCQLFEVVSNKSLALETENRWVWKGYESAEFSVKFAYGLLSRGMFEDVQLFLKD